MELLRRARGYLDYRRRYEKEAEKTKQLLALLNAETSVNEALQHEVSSMKWKHKHEVAKLQTELDREKTLRDQTDSTLAGLIHALKANSKAASTKGDTKGD